MPNSEKKVNRNSTLLGSSQISTLSNDELLKLADWLLLNEEPVDKQSMEMLLEELAKRLPDEEDYDGL